MRAKLIVGLAIFIMAITVVGVSAQYPSVAEGDGGPNVPGPTRTTGCNYSFVVDAPLGTFQSVQVVVAGVANDMIYDNGAWRADVCTSSGQTYFYRVTTRFGVTFEGSIHKI